MSNDWQSIGTAPFGVYLLLRDKENCDSGYTILKKDADGVWANQDNGSNSNPPWFRPTHWMPLPEPPKEGI